MTSQQLQEYAAMRRMMRMVCHPTEGFSKSVSAAVLRELTLRQQEVVYLYYYQQMSMQQVAEILGVHISTVSRTLKRARERLRRCLGYHPRFRQDSEGLNAFVQMMEERYL